MIKKIVILVAITFIFGCYGGQDVPNISNKSVNTEQVASDSSELLKEVNSKLALLETNLTLPELEVLKSTIEGYKDKVKSIDLIKKIDSALVTIEAKIAALKGKEEIAKKISEIESEYVSIAKINLVLPKGNSVSQLDSLIEEAKKYIATLEGLKSTIDTILKSLDSSYENEKATLNKIASEISKKIFEITAVMDSAINTKVGLADKEEIEKAIVSKIEKITKEIGSVVSITVLDSNIISFLNNIKSAIDSTNDINNLDVLRSNLIKMEPDINKGIADNNFKLAKISELISSLESLLKEAEKSGSSSVNTIKNLIASLQSAKQVAEKDAAQLQNFKNIILDSKKATIDKINSLKESQFINSLKDEYNKTISTVEPKLTEITQAIKVKELIAAKDEIEEILNTSFEIDGNTITRLESIKNELEKIDLSSYYETLAEIREMINILAVKGGKYLEGIDAKIASIDSIVKSLDEIIKVQKETVDNIPDIIEEVNETIAELKTFDVEEPVVAPILSQDDVNDSVFKEVYNIILDSKNGRSFEKTKQLIKEIKTVVVKNGKKVVSKNTYKTKENIKIKYIEVNGDEITFYRVVRKLVYNVKNERQEGSNTVIETVKRYEFVNKPVKKWKIEVVNGEPTIVNIYQSKIVKGVWTNYKKIKSFTLGTKSNAYDKIKKLGIVVENSTINSKGNPNK
ncbi:MAG TPA: hypothetical protein PKW55_07440 [Spirochaetota bacterium]|nr:hypothetical protein [Spirochaetota bacterium]HOM38586.1 hypothetical protein [Spirochaetota bacterium]HPQ49723.1 hypothetical protein [Spirochaetota bacterium]